MVDGASVGEGREKKKSKALQWHLLNLARESPAALMKASGRVGWRGRHREGEARKHREPSVQPSRRHSDQEQIGRLVPLDTGMHLVIVGDSGVRSQGSQPLGGRGCVHELLRTSSPQERGDQGTGSRGAWEETRGGELHPPAGVGLFRGRRKGVDRFGDAQSGGV